MEVGGLIAVVELMKAAGPWALVGIIGWAYWKKDAQYKSTMEALFGLVERNTAAATKMESALGSLRDLIATLAKQ